jgi:hypothetical protein
MRPSRVCGGLREVPIGAIKPGSRTPRPTASPSSIGAEDGVSFTHFPWAWATGDAKISPTIHVMRYARVARLSLGILPTFSASLTASLSPLPSDLLMCYCTVFDLADSAR